MGEGCVWDVHHSELRRELLRVGDRLEAKLTAENEFVAWTPVELVKVLKDYTVSFLKSDAATAHHVEGCVWDVYGSELRREKLRVGDRLAAKLTTDDGQFAAWTPVKLVNDLEDGSYTVRFLKSDAATAHHVEGCVWDVHHSELRRELLRVGDRLEAKLTAENEFVAWTPVELVKVLKDYTVSFLKSDDIVANARRAEGIEWDVYGSELRRRGVQVTGAGIAKMNGWYGHAEAAQGPPKVWVDALNQCTVCNGKPLVCTKTGTCKHDPLHGKVDPAHKEKWHKPCPKGCQKTREVLQSQWQ